MVNKHNVDYHSNPFLTAIWLFHSLLWATVEGKAPLIRCLSLCFFLVLPEGHQEPHNKLDPKA